ncbi:MAG: RluA family pseudouridine synthase [Bacillota bacterium]
MIDNNCSDNLEILIDKESGLTAKEVLKDIYNFSSRGVRRLKKRKFILLNDKSIKTSRKVKKGDRLKVLFKYEKLNYEPQQGKLDILYEDGDILVLNKPPFIVVHPTKTHKKDTLANYIANYFKNNNIRKKIRFVNRLDMDTSGIIIIAKNSYAHQYIQKQMESKTIKKKYKAIISNSLDAKKGTINKPIGKEKKGDICRKVLKNGKKSITKYQTIKEFNNYTLVDIDLITGRTHQIRVHFSSLGNPLLGDELYGEKSNLINRQALHSYYLKLKVPRKKESVEISSKLPNDMSKALEKMR